MSINKAKISVDLNRRLGVISPNLYGSTWDWRDSVRGDSVHGGIWVGDDDTIPHIDGFHQGVIAALKELSLPVIQFFPQSPFYNWEDGVGPREKRPRLLLPWGRVQGHEPVEISNDVGTDEFIRFCRLLGAEPLLDTNENDPLGSKNWVEYCNYDGGTKYARLRAEHGHPEPYKVKYWHVYAWGDMEPDAHARDFRKFAAAARLIDPSIEMIGSAVGGSKWVKAFFETLDRAFTPVMGGISLVDHMAYMHYFGVLMKDVDFTDDDYYRLLRNTEGLDDRLREYDATLRFYSQGRQPWAHNWLQEPYSKQAPQASEMKIVISEWAVNWASRICTMRDAIAAAGILDTYHRWADRIHMALSYNLTGGQALVQTHADKVWVTPTYHLFNMYKPHRNNEAVEIEMECESIEVGQGEGNSDFFGSLSVARDQPLSCLTSSASVNAAGSEVILSVTNRHLTDEIEAQIALEGANKPVSGTLTLLAAKEIRDYNDGENPDRVRPQTEDFEPQDCRFSLNFPPHSITVIRLNI